MTYWHNFDLYKFHSTPEKLHGHHEADIRVPTRVGNLMSDIIYRNKPMPPKLEKLLITDPKYAEFAAEYAVDKIKGRWPEAEKNISTDSDAAFSYVKNVLKKPWPEGEAAISKDSYNALLYATNILGKPWPRGEDAIAEKASNSVEYARVLKIRFKKGENEIVKVPFLAMRYIQTILKKPWPEAEDAIGKESVLSFEYAQKYLKGPFPKGEKVLAKNGQLSFRYAVEVLKRRFEKGEKAIKRTKAWPNYCEHFNLDPDTGKPEE